jgi:murein DD-endopeptidase MepM/ murein hydrolase activator NlpD
MKATSWNLSMFRKVLLAVFLAAFIFCSVFPVSAQSSQQLPGYIVQPGDTLLTIASRFGVSVDDIVTVNQIQDQNLISPGDTLLIPGLQGISGTLTSLTVPLGENLTSLASSYATSPEWIARINRLTSPYEVYTGATLIVPVLDTAIQRSPVGVITSSNTLLEEAASLDQNPWVLEESNSLNTRSMLPGSLIYAVAAEGAPTVNVFDASLNQVSIQPLPLMQGGTFEVKVSAAQPVTLEGNLAGNKLNFFADPDGSLIALQGIHAMAQPGVYDFALKGQYSDGSSFSISQPILLVSGGYPKEAPLTVDPATIDPAATQPEDDFLRNLVSAATPTRYWSGVFTLPGEYAEFNSRFGVRRSYNGSAYTYFHSGLDFAGGLGLPIKAAGDGVVVFAGPLTVRGNATVIDHGWGVYTAYYHQSEIKVKAGDKVKAGELIGLVGNTGRVDRSANYPGAGAHLHWEVWVNGIQVNPMDWLYNQYP